MPIHDWTRVDAGLFHHFHQHWIVALCDSLNSGGLPSGYDSLICGVAVATASPRAQIVQQAEVDLYASRADRVTIRHRLGDIVAVIEIVSPGNKSGRAALNTFIAKAVEFVRQGIHLLVIDLFPPSTRDPQVIHKAIWDEVQDEPLANKHRLLRPGELTKTQSVIDRSRAGGAAPVKRGEVFGVPEKIESITYHTMRPGTAPLEFQTEWRSFGRRGAIERPWAKDEPFTLPSSKPLTIASYSAGIVKVAYVEPVAVGDELPSMPIFLEPERYVPAPLEETYQTTWDLCPGLLKEAVLSRLEQGTIEPARD